MLGLRLHLISLSCPIRSKICLLVTADDILVYYCAINVYNI